MKTTKNIQTKMFYCMPLAKNIKNPDKDWELKKCEECGRVCYDMKIPTVQSYLDAVEAIKVCTGCALKIR